MTENFDLQLFISTFSLIFLVELPDKTAVTILILGAGRHPFAVFLGACAAFIIQSLVAVLFGSALALLPVSWVKIGAGILFIVFAGMMWKQSSGSQDPENPKNSQKNKKKDSTFGAVLTSTFMMIFLAEWGDLTQLATAALVAKHQAPVTIFVSSVLALWAVTGIAVLLGHSVKKWINPTLLQRVAAIVFLGVGIWILFH